MAKRGRWIWDEGIQSRVQLERRSFALHQQLSSGQRVVYGVHFDPEWVSLIVWRGMILSSASFLSLSFSSGRTGKVSFFRPFLFCFSFPPSQVAASLVIHHEVGSDSQSDQMECPQPRLPDGKIWSLPCLGLCQGGGRGGAIQGKEGIKFCSVA